MFAEEWPLLLFTLFTQLAVGLYIFIVIIRAMLKEKNEVVNKLTSKGLLLVGPITIIALILSVFHLGVPLGAYRAILNFGTAWLSREIVFVGGFFALWAVTYFLERKGDWNQALGWGTSLVGVGAIVSMASIYTNSIMPAWSDVNTYIAFMGTTILFGSVSAMILLSFAKEQANPSIKKLIVIFTAIGLVAILIQLIYLPVYTSGLAVNGGAAGLESIVLLTETFALTNIFRWLATIVGLGLVSWILMKTSKKINYSFLITAFLLVIVGEFLGRYIFYSIGVQIVVG